MTQASPELRLHQALYDHEQKWGERATLAQVRLHFGQKMPGPAINPHDVEIHARAAELLLADPELILQQRNFEPGWLRAAIRRAVKEDPLPAELDENGEPKAEEIDRLRRSFPYVCFDDGPGLDEGLLYR
jgi:hypothetical protein